MNTELNENLLENEGGENFESNSYGRKSEYLKNVGWSKLVLGLTQWRINVGRKPE